MHLCRAELSEMVSGGRRDPPRQGARDRLYARGLKDRGRAAPRR